jgi:hypothetical protein
VGLRKSLRKLLGYKQPDIYLNATYSQEGEDGMLGRIFEHKPNGFFVDVGAHHPKRFSNTYYFYNKGWRGINIDAMPGSMAAFDKIRPLDINLEIPVSGNAEVLPFYIFNEPALNTFSKEVADERAKKKDFWVEKVVDIKTQPLAGILDDHLPKNTHIDFITIDAEGLDFEILKSNNWDKYSADVVLVESEYQFTEFIESELYKYMQSKSYGFFGKTVKTYFLKKESFIV